MDKIPSRPTWTRWLAAGLFAATASPAALAALSITTIF